MRRLNIKILRINLDGLRSKMGYKLKLCLKKLVNWQENYYKFLFIYKQQPKSE